MTIIAYKEQGFTSVSIVTKRTNGSLVTPDAAPICEFFRVNPTNGTQVKDLAMGTAGSVSMTLVPGSAYLYAAAIDLSPAAFDLYSLVLSYQYDAASGSNSFVIPLVLSRPDTIIYRSRNITIGSVGTTFKAPTPA